MFNGQKILAIVPARGGSKGVARKNVREICGCPLIKYTLDTAKNVDWIDCLVVSTDNEEIAALAKDCGVEVLDRPDELAQDQSPTEEALLHAISVLEGTGRTFDILLVLEPTSPLRSINTIKAAIEMSVDVRFDSVLAVFSSKQNIGEIIEDRFIPLRPNAPRRRQEREPFYFEASTIYACKISYLLESKTLVTPNWGAVLVDEREALDINTVFDLEYAEFLIQKLSGRG
jgi:CMP-N,N'-diacetyllegionaminic acid synthase